MLQRIARLNSIGKKYAIMLYYRMQIQKTSLFDKAYYLSAYPDVAASKQDPIWHYLMYGAKEGRNPSLVFNTDYYLRNNPDVKNSGMNPLVHYLRYGDVEGRRPHPLFDNVFYRMVFKERLAKEQISLEHYLKNSHDYTLRPHPLFHTAHYISVSSVYKTSSKAPLECYLENIEIENMPFSEVFEDGQDERTAVILSEDAFGADYIRHIDNDEVLRLSLMERLEQRDLEGLDYLYRSTLPSRVSEQLHAYTPSGRVYKVRSLYEYACEYQLILKDDNCETWSMYSKSLERNLNLNQPRVYIARLVNVNFVAGTRLIFKDDVLLHDELSLYDHSGKEYGVKLWNHTKALDANQVEVFNTKSDDNARIKKGILLSCDHDNNYFHWMIECMAKVCYLRSVGQLGDYPILISETLHPNLKKALQFLIGDDYPVYELEEGTVYKIDELIVPSDMSRILDKYSGEYNAEVDVALSKKWIGAVKAEFCITGERVPYRKLYLTRKTGTYRKLINEEEIELSLLKLGFEVIDLSTASLAFQQELFCQAALIVAPTGATITNMLLAPKNCRFVILTSDHEGVHFNLWEQLAEACEIDLANAKGNRMFNRDDFHDDYSVDVEGLLKLVEIC